jgi:hypothetical protein
VTSEQQHRNKVASTFGEGNSLIIRKEEKAPEYDDLNINLNLITNKE